MYSPLQRAAIERDMRRMNMRLARIYAYNHRMVTASQPFTQIPDDGNSGARPHFKRYKQTSTKSETYKNLNPGYMP